MHSADILIAGPISSAVFSDRFAEKMFPRNIMITLAAR